MTTWISVKDELPLRNTLVLVATVGWVEGYEFGFWDGEIWRHRNGRPMPAPTYPAPTHWQPLTPPKEDK